MDVFLESRPEAGIFRLYRQNRLPKKILRRVRDKEYGNGVTEHHGCSNGMDNIVVSVKATAI